MFRKLHERQTGERRPATGLSCDEEGLYFAGHCPLIERVGETPHYRRRPMGEINRVLSAGYGAEIDLAEREPVLDRITKCLEAGEIGRAQLLALQLPLPDLASDDDVERLAKAEEIVRFNHHHDELGLFTFADNDGGGGGGGTAPAARVSVKRSTSPTGVGVVRQGIPNLIRLSEGGQRETAIQYNPPSIFNGGQWSFDAVYAGAKTDDGQTGEIKLPTSDYSAHLHLAKFSDAGASDPDFEEFEQRLRSNPNSILGVVSRDGGAVLYGTQAGLAAFGANKGAIGRSRWPSRSKTYPEIYEAHIR